MRKYQSAFDNIRIESSKFDSIIEWLLVCLLAFMPLAFGVVQAWSEMIVVALSGVIVLCFLLKLVFNRHSEIIWSWSYIPIGLFIFIVILQLIPLPVGIVSVISPNTAALKTELLGDLPQTDNALKSMTLSFYPNATKHDLRLILAVAGVFIVVLNVFRSPERIKRLLMAITIIGAAIAAIALTQNIFGNDKIYWLISSSHCKGYSGPFVNHSNYGQFMNLSIGAALGWLCVKLNGAFAGKKAKLPDVVNYLSTGPGKSLWLLAAMIGLCMATLFVSLTRGGVVSMLIAMILTTLLFASKQSCRSYSWIMVIIALVAFTCVLYVSFDAVYDRLASLKDFDNAQGSRLQMLKDTLVAWTRFPITGTGLGTYSVVYPMFDRSTNAGIAAYAENEYAQVLAETGLVGLGLLIFLGIIVLSSLGKNLCSSGQPALHQSGTGPVCSAAYGLCFGIIAILIHSLSDFGQHLPANAMLSAIFCALLLVLARSQKNSLRRQAGTFAFFTKSIPLRTGVLIGVCVLWGWSFTNAAYAFIAESHWQKTIDTEKYLKKTGRQATEAEYADLVSQAKAAVKYQTDNIKYQHWLNVYRWFSISKTVNADTGQIVLADDSMPAVRKIVADFHKALEVCPTYGQSYSMAGQIEKFILHNDCGAESIRKGYRLAPCDPIACFAAGRLDVIEGKTQDAIAKLERAVQLDAGLFKNVVEIYVNQLSRPNLSLALAADDIGRLSYVAGVFEDMQYDDLAEQAREKIKLILEAKCSRPNAPGSAFALLGDIYSRLQNNEAAIECYRKALARDYGQVPWRLKLAKLLAEMGRTSEAMQEVKICLQLSPELKAAKTFAANLSVSPAFLTKTIESP
jgi:tetratricopeptide (TPR) repeat protein